MFRHVATFGVAASCAIGSIALAQDAPFTLQEALTAAVEISPSLQVSSADVAAAQAAREAAGLLPNPSFDGVVENVAGSGDYRGGHSAETTLGVVIPIELGGKRDARIRVADAQTRRTLLNAALAGAELRLQITRLYVESVASQARLQAAQEQARIAGEATRAAAARVQAGRASPIEQQRAEVARLNAVAGVERARRLSEAARASLGRRIGIAATAPLDRAWFETLTPETGVTIAPADTLAQALADADYGVADANVRLARAQRIPDVTIGPSVRRLQATDDTAAVFSLSVPLPVFNSGAAALSQAKAERDREDARRRAAALDVEQRLLDARTEAANAADSARSATGPMLAAAEEAARIARIGYREGKFGQLDLLDAERTLAETRLAAIEALAAYQNARALEVRLTTPAPATGNRS